MKHIIFKVRKNKHEDWRSWCNYLCEHQTKAEVTMSEENCTYERSVMYKREGDYYVVGTCLFSGKPKRANLNIEINIKHQESKEEFLSKAIAVFEGEFKLPPTHEVLYEFDIR